MLSFILKNIFIKKLLSISGLILLLFISISFVLEPPKKTDKDHIVSVLKKASVIHNTCNCSTPTNVSAIRSGGIVTLTWNAVSGAVTYSVGGYASCSVTGFSYCATTNSIAFSSSCSVTVRVTANCNGTTCLNATCSSSPSAAAQSN